jgi:SAM-dependent methyltransferase
MIASTSAAFFDEKYQNNPDPWNFEQSEYEQRRYNLLVSELGARIYSRAFEPGCSIGVLTALLAPHCKSLEAIDISANAVQLTQQRCRQLSHVRASCRSLRAGIPGGMFDLIVFSEIGYYFTEAELGGLAESLVRQLEKRGTFLAVHWLGTSRDHVLSGDRVHEILHSLNGLRLIHEARYEAFRLDRWERL